MARKDTPLPDDPRGSWSFRKKASAVVVALVVASGIGLALLHFAGSPIRERHVWYDYTVIIESNASDQFAVICSLPADGGGMVSSEMLTSLVIAGKATASRVTTWYGDGLLILGTGSVNITWNHYFSYRTSTQSYYKHYSNLSMLDGGYGFGLSAFVYSGGANVFFCLTYQYAHVYGNLGADFLDYNVTANLTTGWNVVPVDFVHAVA